MSPRKSTLRPGRLSTLLSSSAALSPAAPPVVIDPLLSDLDLEELTGIPRASWQQKRFYRSGPPFVKIGRLVRYRWSEFQRWRDGLPTLQSTNEASQGSTG